MRGLVCLSLLSIVSVGSVRFRAGHHHHYNLQELASPKLEVFFPPPESRNPSECEVYEKIELPEDGGCQQLCRLSGRLGSMQLSGLSFRQPKGFCKPTGHLCQVRAEDRERLNSTARLGRCSQDCECLPLGGHEVQDRHREFLFNDLLSSTYRVVDVKTEADLKKLPFEVKLSPAEWRSQDRCERFESAHMYESYHAEQSHEGCKVSCSVHGSIGSVNFHLPSRTLTRKKPDGTTCHLNVHRTSDVSVHGAKQRVRGQCRAGFCITEDAQIIKDRILSSMTAPPVVTSPHVPPTAQPMATKAAATYEYVTL